MLLTLLTVVAVFLFYYYAVKPFRYWKERGVPQKFSIIGDSWKVALRMESTLQFVKDIYNRFPGTRYTGIYQFFVPTLVLKDPDLIKQITIKDFDHFVDHRNLIPEESDPLWGKNLFALQGKKWRDMRTLLSPSFTSSKMKSIFVLVKEYSEGIVQHFLNKNQDLCEVESTLLFTHITNDIIASTSLGVKVDSLSQPDNPFYAMGRDLTDFTKFRTAVILTGNIIFKNFSNIFGLKLFSKETRTMFNDIINQSVKLREESDIKRPDIINLMVQARKNGQKSLKENLANLTNDDIASQAMIFFLGGFETISNFLFFVSYELALNPDIQAKLRQEINDTLEECNGDVTYETIFNMKYMDMVVSEGLRKWPIFLTIDRECTKDYTIEPTGPNEKPVDVKAGASLWLPIYGIHHDPKYYPDPERFDPERFSDENKHKINSYTYFSFGLGPRSCIGSRFALMEAKTVLFYILSKFEIVPTEKTVIPVKINKSSFTLKAEKSWLGFKRIESN